eukprot:1294338-Prymnesium_polylepis.2
MIPSRRASRPLRVHTATHPDGSKPSTVCGGCATRARARERESGKRGPGTRAPRNSRVAPKRFRMITATPAAWNASDGTVRKK